VRPPASVTFPPRQPPDTRIIPPLACRIEPLPVCVSIPPETPPNVSAGYGPARQRRGGAGAAAGADERTAEGEITPWSTMKRASMAAAVSAPATLKCTSS
jgi:hypothetical protein